jgi:hypothetical protein
VRIDVAGGHLTRAVLVETGQVMPGSGFATVEALFVALGAANGAEGLNDVIVEFDRQLGFPTRIEFDSRSDTGDWVGSYYLRNAGALLTGP